MAATIKIKNSSTAGAAPTSSDLVQGELAVNVTDKRLFTENASGTVVELGTNPSSITLPDGSASAPTLLHSGDTNTGLFFPAADTIALTTGGTERARVDSSGNLGIGTTSPSTYGQLAVVSSSTNSTSLNAINTSTSGGSLLVLNCGNGTTSAQYNYISFVNNQTTSQTWRFGNYGGNNLTWQNVTAGTAAMTLDTSGNLLVNTTTAREKITVNGSIAASGQLIPYSGSTSLGYIGNDSSISGGSGSNIGLRSEAAMLFATGGSTERARIDSSGNLLINATASPAGHKGIYTYNPNSGSNTNLSNIGTSSGTAYHWTFLMNTTEVGSIRTTSSATTYATSSDYRLKENIAPMTGALAVVAQLNPCTYTWKVDGSSGQGFIAHELQAVLPDAVTGEKDAVNEDGSIRPQGIDTSFLVATLTAAIQELKAEFDAYKASHP